MVTISDQQLASASIERGFCSLMRQDQAQESSCIRSIVPECKTLKKYWVDSSVDTFNIAMRAALQGVHGRTLLSKP